MTTTNINALQQLTQGSIGTSPQPTSGSFFEALSTAWGVTLDRKSEELKDKANALTADGGDTPGNVTALSAAASEFQFLSESAHTSDSAAAQGLQSVAKQ
jgi:hypothetical protein